MPNVTNRRLMQAYSLKVSKHLISSLITVTIVAEMIEDNVEDVTKKELFWVTSNIIGRSYNSVFFITPKYSKQFPFLIRILQLTVTYGNT